MTKQQGADVPGILSMVSDMETIETFVGRKGRFVGDMVHISIADLAALIRADQTALDTQKPAWDAERFWRGYPDNKPDNTGLDDGPPLSKSEVRSWKKPLVIKAFQEGLSARACGRVFDVNHETAAQWTSGISRAALAGKPKDGGDVVPGVMHCAKCKFQLIRTNLYFGNGTTGPGDNKTEPCPNGCGPLWPVSWKQQAMELGERLEEVWKENEGLKALTADNAKRGE
jgi:hypothetical protein